MNTSPAQRYALAGYGLIFAAISFWLAWWFMPDAGTNDAAHILGVVRAARPWVLLSVVVQIISSVAFVPPLLALSQLHGGTRLRFVGISLLLIGAMGMCADAFFHLFAYYMTADSIAPADVLAAMTLLQTDGLRYLAPLLLPFFIGSLLLALALKREGLSSSLPVTLFSLALLGVPLGGVVVAQIGSGRHALVLSFLGLFALGLMWLGVEVVKRGSSRSFAQALGKEENAVSFPHLY